MGEVKTVIRRLAPGILGLCGIAVAATSASAAEAAGSCAGPVTLGTTISSTGQHASSAAKWRGLTIEFAKLINERGGVSVGSCGKKLPLKFVIYDDQSDPATAASLYQRLATVDKVDFLVGPDRAVLAKAVVSVADAQKIPIVMANVRNAQIVRRGGGYVWATPMPTIPNWSARYFDMLSRQSPKPRTIMFATEDHPFTRAITDHWAKQARLMGLEVLSRESFASDQADFTALILKLRLRRPDILYISSHPAPSVPLIRQMRKLKLRARNVHHAMPSAAMAKELGADLQGVTGDISWYPGVDGPYADFAAELLKRAGIDMFEYPETMARIAAYLVMVQGVERAGAVEREKVRKALHMGTFDAPTGPHRL